MSTTQAQKLLKSKCANAKCGRDLPRQVTFCPYCGERQVGADPPPRKGADTPIGVTVTLEEVARGGSRDVVVAGRHIGVPIPVGVSDGQQLRLHENGVPGERGGPSGDVIVTFSIEQHPRFTRDGRDLHMELPVTTAEIAAGSKMVQTLTGAVTLSIPSDTADGRVLRLKGKGIPASGENPAGDLCVKLRVTNPQPDAEKQPRKVEQSKSPSRHLVRKRLVLGAVILFCIAAIAYYTFSGGAAMLEVTVQPGQWQTVELDKLSQNSAIAISADGPFRIRTIGADPIVVDGERPVDLGRFTGKSIEIKTAIDHAVHIHIQASH